MLEAIWAMVERDIPTIKRRVESVLRELLIE
jgi:hypothetical protein